MLFTFIIGIVALIYYYTGFSRDEATDGKILKITIPEALDYSGAFDDLLSAATKSSKLVAVRSTNMGSTFRLTYNIQMKEGVSEKKLLDDIRCRNGNLEVSLTESGDDDIEL